MASSVLVEYKDEEYNLTIEIYDEEEVKTLTSKGKTLTEAFENADRKTENTIYYRHLNAILITDGVDIKEVVYYFFRNPDTNDNFAMVYAPETDGIYEDKDKNVGELIVNNLRQDDLFTFFEIMKNFTNNTRDLTFPIFDGKRFNGIKTLKGTEILGTLDEHDDNILMPLIGKEGTFLDTKCDGDNHFVIKIEGVNTKYKIEDKIKVSVSIEASLRELTCDIDTSKVDGLIKLERLANKDLEKKIQKLIDKFKEDETDTLGINTLIKDKYHNLDRKFYDFEYEVEADISIYKKGLLLK